MVKNPLMLALVALVIAGCAAPVQVTWDTETEIDTAGFNLFRGDSPDGPFDVRVNDKLIPTSSDPVRGGHYSVTDSSTRPGATYYYQLQEVETDGNTNTFGPIVVTASWISWSGLTWGALLAVLVILGGMLVWRSVDRRGQYKTKP